MIYAYDKVYLRIAQRNLGEMLSYAVYDLGYELEDYYKRFLQSEYSVRFSKGDLFVITGMSGAELAIRVLNIPDDDIIMPSYNTAKSQEYWTGWILAYYQWENGRTFEMIDKEIPICKIRNMYNPYHEMDISSAILKLREMSQVSRAETYLKKLRKRAGISQSVLAEETGSDTYNPMTDEKIDAYLAQPEFQTATLEKIVSQQWINLYRQPEEMWATWKRTGLPKFKDNPMPEDGVAFLETIQQADVTLVIPRRNVLPTPNTLNIDNFNAAVKLLLSDAKYGETKDLTEGRIWWDVE